MKDALPSGYGSGLPMGRRLAAFAALLLIAGNDGARSAEALKQPAIVNPLPPPEDKSPRAAVVPAPYRHDDLLWENDRTAHRIYGEALEAAEPPSGSGMDSWGKNVPWPFADRQLRTGNQHDYHGEGLDFFHVGGSRGAGGLGVWYDNKLWVSRNYRTLRILRDGPDVADFEVTYAPWPVDVGRKVWETRRFTLPLGTQFTRLVSTLHSDRQDELIVGVGIGRRTTDAVRDGELTVDRARGFLSWWGPEIGDRGRMGIALKVDPAMIADIRTDADNYLILLRVRPDQPFVYYSGSVWSLGNSGIGTRETWDRHVADAPVNFMPPIPSSPR